MSLEEVAALRLPWGWSGPTMPKYRELHTLENPKQFPIRPPHLDHRRLRCGCFPQLHWKHIVVWGKYQDEGRMWEGEVGPTTSGRLDRSRLKGARPCLGLPILPPILTPLLSSLDIMVCSNMIIKMNHLCAGKGYFLVTSGSSKSNLNQNIFSEKPDSECLHLSPMAGFFLVVTNGEFVSGRHQQIYPALTLLRQTVQLCKFSTSVLFSRSRLHRQHFSAQLIISTFPHHSTHELMEYR